MKPTTVLFKATAMALAMHCSTAQDLGNPDAVRRVQVVTSASEPANVKLRNLVNPAPGPVLNADEPRPTDGKDNPLVASSTSSVQESALPSTAAEKQDGRSSPTRPSASTAASQATATHQSSASNAASGVVERAHIGWAMAVAAGAVIPWLY
ncbi:hypothetical protein H4R34_003047 [Dimargaris verticillata]|uniref:Uncharacterized protein n=1 Tax=Dimargaris verticillata TaxID=2761393 RepID=A0A9W8B896_9FUNG|nr:hypothetical protein H4R34_003047 [Dimargaris verticillata]